MKKRNLILAFAGTLFLAVFSIVLIGLLGASFKTSKEKETVVQAEPKEAKESLSLEETIRSFAEILYTYDTRERKFYEGAEEYMTEEAYDKLIPMPDSDAGETSVTQMTSCLQEVTCYYRIAEDDRLDVLTEIWYTLSGTGDFRVRQILKLSLVKRESWKISECTVLDTMEQ